MNKLIFSSLVVSLFAILPAQAFDFDKKPTSMVPEPSTYVLFGIAFLMLGIIGYRSRNKKS